MATLSSHQVQDLDAYRFLAVLGTWAIHPGGRARTDRLLDGSTALGGL
jgi:hypothetical protein